MSVVIVTDSTCDLTPLDALSMNVRVVPLRVMFGDESYLQGEEMDNETFYTRLANESVLPTTSQPSPEDFLIPFQQSVNAGDSVVALVLSSALSGTLQSASIASQLAGGDIRIVDSLHTIASQRLLVEYAVRLRDAGKSAGEIEQALLALRPRVRLMGVVDTLEYLYKGGRLSRGAALVGSLLRMKPVLKLEDGQIAVLGKMRGLNAAVSLMLDQVENSKGIDPAFPLYLGYTGLDEAPCRLLAQRIQDRFQLPIPDRFYSVGCVIGTHTGPGACLMAYVEKA